MLYNKTDGSRYSYPSNVVTVDKQQTSERRERNRHQPAIYNGSNTRIDLKLEGMPRPPVSHVEATDMLTL